jgi:hypothetical protein
MAVSGHQSRLDSRLNLQASNYEVIRAPEGIRKGVIETETIMATLDNV